MIVSPCRLCLWLEVSSLTVLYMYKQCKTLLKQSDWVFYLTLKQHVELLESPHVLISPFFLPLIRIQTSHSGQDHLRRRPQFFVALQRSGLPLCCFLFCRTGSFIFKEFEIFFFQKVISIKVLCISISSWFNHRRAVMSRLLPALSVSLWSCSICESFPWYKSPANVEECPPDKTPHTHTQSSSTADVSNLTCPFYLPRGKIMTQIHGEPKQHTDTHFQASRPEYSECLRQRWYDASVYVPLRRARIPRKTSVWSTSPNPSRLWTTSA